MSAPTFDPVYPGSVSAVPAQAAARLAEWAQEDAHFTQSVRHWQPHYANPAELRADVRALLARVAELQGLLDNEALYRAEYLGYAQIRGNDAERAEAEAKRLRSAARSTDRRARNAEFSRPQATTREEIRKLADWIADPTRAALAGGDAA